MALNPGDIIDEKYRIVRLLGEGGMGAVYEGENTRISRRVAIKVLHATVAESQDAVQRFEREAQAAGRIGSEHIVEVLDLGTLPSGDRYMVMEYLDGDALSDRIEKRGRLPAQVTAPIIIQMLEGLRAAHDAGIIHRDLKPDNVFLLASRGGQKDFVKLLDFGISKFNTLGGEFSMTRTGAVMGTPYYMSPEQAKGNRDVDHRADLYAVGVILFEAAAGEVPFNAETFNELLFKIVLEEAPKLTDKVPGIDPGFAAVVEKAMAREPDQRFQTATELQDALRAWLAGADPLPDQTASGGTPNAFDRTALPRPGDQPSTARPKTQGAWAASGDYGDPAATPAKKTGLYAAIAAGAILVLGGGGYFVSASSAAEEEAAAAAQAEAEKRAEEEKKRAEELARLEAEKDKAEEERKKAEAAAAEAQAKAEAAKTAQSKAEAERLAREAEEEAERKAQAAAAAAARARRQASAPKKPSQPSTTATQGRKIRTEL